MSKNTGNDAARKSNQTLFYSLQIQTHKCGEALKSL